MRARSRSEARTTLRTFPRAPIAHGAAIRLATQLGDAAILVDVLTRAEAAERSPWAASSLALSRARLLWRSDPQLASRRISPRTIRHTASMHLLQRGTDLGQITRWLGHDTPATMHNHARAYRSLNDRTVNRFSTRTSEPAQRESLLLEFTEAF